MFSELAYGKTDKDEEFDKKCAALWGYDGKEFYSLDSARSVKYDCEFKGYYGSASKIAFYEDLLLGIMHDYLPETAIEEFSDAAKRLSALAKKKSDYAYLFDTLAKLCDFDALKTSVARKIYSAYKNDDREEIKKTLCLFKDLKRKEKIFYNAFYKQWHKENKSIGFEIQNIRFGGVARSIEYAEKRLRLWCDGKISKIEELEQTRLPFNPDSKNLYASFFRWKDIVSKSYLSHQ